uniref:Oxidation resistance protein 1 n=1 Tax=Arion vulgaris TaxID=1028688 RepID=A0A0B7A634_9EUPU
MLNEYWFVVPHNMAEKLYNFLMTWQPDAYGDEEETEPRDKFFYDTRNMIGLSQSSVKVGDGSPQEELFLSEDHFRETEKTWEILSKEEVYGAEKEQAIYRQDTLDECNIPDLIGPTVIIKQEYLRDIIRSLPRNMSVGYNWELVYATHKHGYSLQNLYMRTEGVEFDSPVLLFIKDIHESVFGAYLSNTIRPSETFYGSGATFLFTFFPKFKKFPWCGDNQFFMHGTRDFFAIGSGEGLFGLWLDGALDKGRSHPCTTFFNDVLTTQEDFNILQLEVWRFVDSSLC